LYSIYSLACLFGHFQVLPFTHAEEEVSLKEAVEQIIDVGETGQPSVIGDLLNEGNTDGV